MDTSSPCPRSPLITKYLVFSATFGLDDLEDLLRACIPDESTGELVPCTCAAPRNFHRTPDFIHGLLKRALVLRWECEACPNGRIPLQLVLKHVFRGDPTRLVQYCDHDLANIRLEYDRSFLHRHISQILEDDLGEMSCYWYGHPYHIRNIELLLQFGCSLPLLRDGSIFKEEAADLVSELVFSDGEPSTKQRFKRRCFQLLEAHGQLEMLLQEDGRGLIVNLYPSRTSITLRLYDLSRSWVVPRQTFSVATSAKSTLQRQSKSSPLVMMLAKGWLPVAEALMRRGAPIHLAGWYNGKPPASFLDRSSLALLSGWHRPWSERELLDSLYDGSPFQELVLTLLLIRSHQLESNWALLPNELLFQILMAVGHDYSYLLSPRG